MNPKRVTQIALDELILKDMKVAILGLAYRGGEETAFSGAFPLEHISDLAQLSMTLCSQMKRYGPLD